MQEILIQILGFIGAAVSMFSFQSKKRSGILLLQIFSAACFGLHFTLLGAVSGAALNFLALARAMVFYFRGSKKWASSIVWLPVFILCSVGAVALTWEGPISLLPMTGMILTTFAQYSSSAKMVI